MKRVRFPLDVKDLGTEIPSSNDDINLSGDQDEEGGTWYHTDDFRSFRESCRALIEEAQFWSITTLLEGTTKLTGIFGGDHGHGHPNRRKNDDREDEETRRLQAAKLSGWSMSCHNCRGLEKMISRSHGKIREEQAKLHCDAVLRCQKRLSDVETGDGRPSFFDDELSHISRMYSTSSSILARNMGIADSIVVNTERETSKLETERKIGLARRLQW